MMQHFGISQVQQKYSLLIPNEGIQESEKTSTIKILPKIKAIILEAIQLFEENNSTEALNKLFNKQSLQVLISKAIFALDKNFNIKCKKK